MFASRDRDDFFRYPQFHIIPPGQPPQPAQRGPWQRDNRQPRLPWSGHDLYMRVTGMVPGIGLPGVVALAVSPGRDALLCATLPEAYFLFLMGSRLA